MIETFHLNLFDQSSITIFGQLFQTSQRRAVRRFGEERLKDRKVVAFDRLLETRPEGGVSVRHSRKIMQEDLNEHGSNVLMRMTRPKRLNQLVHQLAIRAIFDQKAKNLLVRRDSKFGKVFVLHKGTIDLKELSVRKSTGDV